MGGYINAGGVIAALAVLCTIIMLLMVFGKRLKNVFKALGAGALLMAAALGINIILSPFGANIGLNPANYAVMSALGIPGFVMLYVLKIFLR